MKITQLFIDGTLEGLTYTSDRAWSAEACAEYTLLMNSRRILGGGVFGSRYVIVSVEYLEEQVT
jgi:hypothetical protein